MSLKIYDYTCTTDDMFENVLTDDRLILNHVVIEAGKTFPRHATDAIVYIIVIKGTINITLEEDKDEITLSKGKVVNIPFGTETTLGNKEDTEAEVFVIKIKE